VSLSVLRSAHSEPAVRSYTSFGVDNEENVL
jgi:hypothetical protein